MVQSLRFYICICLVLGGTVCFSQQDKSKSLDLKRASVVKQYKDKQFYGKSRIVKAEGTIVVRRYIASQDLLVPVGEWRYYHKNARLMRQVWYDAEGQPIDKEKVFHKNGKLKYEIKWNVSDTEDMLYKQNKNEILIIGKSFYTKEYRADGSLKCEGLRLNNNGEEFRNKHGVWLFFDKKGVLTKEVVFEDGRVLKVIKH